MVNYGVESNVKGKIMLIRELAKLAGTPVDTIRFYEKQGLLNEEHFIRTSNKYRVYNTSAIDRLHLIRCAKRLGFRLLEIKPLLSEVERNAMGYEQQEAVLTQKLTEIAEHIQSMEYMRHYIQKQLQAVRDRKAQQVIAPVDVLSCNTASIS